MLRGEAYLAAHKGSEAAAEFQKILDHRGIVLNEPIGALAHLQLGRATRWRRHCQEPRRVSRFCDVVERRRSRHPHPQQAKAEYAKLQ